jgi:hypothetical protein
VTHYLKQLHFNRNFYEDFLEILVEKFGEIRLLWQNFLGLEEQMNISSVLIAVMVKY